VTARDAGPALGVSVLAVGLALATAGAWLLGGTGSGFPAPPGETRPPAAPIVTAEGRSGPLDLNREGADSLQRLPGVGPVLAARIVAHRATRGRFRNTEELREVPGIGRARWERLRPLVRTGTP
jgi:competence protein ComEA